MILTYNRHFSVLNLSDNSRWPWRNYPRPGHFTIFDTDGTTCSFRRYRTSPLPIRDGIRELPFQSDRGECCYQVLAAANPCDCGILAKNGVSVSIGKACCRQPAELRYRQCNVLLFSCNLHQWNELRLSPWLFSIPQSVHQHQRLVNSLWGSRHPWL